VNIPTTPAILVLGNEGKGISHDVLTSVAGQKYYCPNATKYWIVECGRGWFNINELFFIKNTSFLVYNDLEIWAKQFLIKGALGWKH
jgi:hypothetical protein